MIRTLLLDEAGPIGCRGSILHRQLLSAWRKWDWLMPTRTKRARKSSCCVFWRCHSCPSTTLNWRFTFQDVRATVGADTHKNMHQSSWQQRLYPYTVPVWCKLQRCSSQCSCAWNQLRLGRRRWRNDWYRIRSGRGTDSGWSTAERRLRGVLNSIAWHPTCSGPVWLTALLSQLKGAS